MTTSLIIGSGPAAAGAALALVRDPSQRVTVLDIGHHLEPDLQDIIDRMAAERPPNWTSEDVDAIQGQPAGASAKGLPQKRSYGSDYPFRDVGQLSGVRALDHANRSVISGAYGGLSNVWGSQIMPFTDATFSRWPVNAGEMEGHYRQILSEIPFAAEGDALDEHFPLIGSASPLPPLAPRTIDVLRAFNRHQQHFDRMRVSVGRARLAFNSRECVRCGLCMTGCPYSLIYSSAQTFDRLRLEGRVEYRGSLLVEEVGQSDDVPFAIARDLRTQRLHRFESDRIFVGCGAVGTTRLVLSSLKIWNQDVQFQESAQFVLPMLSKRPTPDPRADSEFTLNQFNMVVALDDEWLNVSQIHFYPHNPAILDGFPNFLKSRMADPITSQLLRRLTVGLGYLPSWESPVMRMKVTPPSAEGELPGVVISGDERTAAGNWMFRRVALQMLKVAPRLDLWPVLPMAFLSAPGKSYHFGGSLPHRTSPADSALTTDRLGRLDGWSRVHMIDASVFPTVPATTFTLTIMANAHRIATESMTVLR